MRITRGGLLRPTPTARTEARALRRLRQGEEHHLRAPRPSRRARRATVDARRAHREDECAVQLPIARQHSAPASGFFHQGGLPSADAKSAQYCLPIVTMAARRSCQGAETIGAQDELTADPNCRLSESCSQSPQRASRAILRECQQRRSGSNTALGGRRPSFLKVTLGNLSVLRVLKELSLVPARAAE